MTELFDEELMLVVVVLPLGAVELERTTLGRSSLAGGH